MAVFLAESGMAQEAAPLDVNREGSYSPSDGSGIGNVSVTSLFGEWEAPLIRSERGGSPQPGQSPSSLVFSARKQIVDGREEPARYYQFNENEIGIVSHGAVRRSCLFFSVDEIVCKAPGDESYIRYRRMKPETCKPETKEEELARTTWVDGDPDAFRPKPPRCGAE